MLHINKALLAAECEALFYRWDVCAYRCSAARRTSLRCLSQFRGSSRFCSRLSWSFISEVLFHQVVNKINTCFHVALQKRWVNNVKRIAAKNRPLWYIIITQRKGDEAPERAFSFRRAHCASVTRRMTFSMWFDCLSESNPDQYLWRFCRKLEAEMSSRTRKNRNLNL